MSIGFPAEQTEIVLCAREETSETESRASSDIDPSFDDNFQAKWWKQGSAIFFPVELFLLNDDDPVAVAAIKEMCRDVKTRVLNQGARRIVAAQANNAAQKRMKPETEDPYEVS